MVRSTRFGRLTWAVCLTVGLWGAVRVEPLQGEETLDERRARIERMDASQKAELRRAQQQFAELDPAEQKRLHELHKQIAAHDQSDELLSVMERYCEWMNTNTLSQWERAELRELAPAERIEKIKQLRDDHARRRQFGPGWARGSYMGEWLRKLSLQEREGLLRWLDQYMDRNAPALVGRLPEEQREKMREELEQANDDPGRRRGVFIQIWVLWQMHARGRPIPLKDEDLEQLRSQLSRRSREWLDKIGPESQRRVLTGMIGALVFDQHHEELSEYLEKEVSARDREILTSLSPEQMRQMLWWRYFNSKWPGMLPGPGRGRPGGPFSGPDGSRGPRRRYDRGDRGGPPGPFGPGDRSEGPRSPREGPGGRLEGPRGRPQGPGGPPEGPDADRRPPPP